MRLAAPESRFPVIVSCQHFIFNIQRLQVLNVQTELFITSSLSSSSSLDRLVVCFISNFFSHFVLSLLKRRSKCFLTQQSEDVGSTSTFGRN